MIEPCAREIDGARLTYRHAVCQLILRLVRVGPAEGTLRRHTRGDVAATVIVGGFDEALPPFWHGAPATTSSCACGNRGARTGVPSDPAFGAAGDRRSSRRVSRVATAQRRCSARSTHRFRSATPTGSSRGRTSFAGDRPAEDRQAAFASLGAIVFLSIFPSFIVATKFSASTPFCDDASLRMKAPAGQISVRRRARDRSRLRPNTGRPCRARW